MTRLHSIPLARWCHAALFFRIMRTPVALSAFLALLSSALAGNWPAWRGPTADGVTPETDIPLHFSATEGVKWKVDLPERGNSTPIVWDGKIFLTQAVGTRRTVM